MHINSIQVPSQPHPGLEICVSSHPGSQIHVSSLSQWNFTSIWVLIFTSHLHPGNISPPSRSTKWHLSSIQASSQTHTCFKMCVSPPSRSFLNWRIVSQLHPRPISPYPRLKMCISAQSRSHLNPIQVSRFVSPLHPGSQIHVSSLPQLNLTSIWVLILHLPYIQVTSRLHPDPPNCILVPSKHHLKPIQVSRCVSHLHPGHFSTRGLYLSYILVPCHPIHVSRCASQLNPGPISTPSRSRDLCFLSTQAPIFTFLLCLSWILLQSGSWYLHLAYIQVTSHLHPGPPNGILVPSKHHLKCIHVSRCVSHLHPGPLSTGKLYLSSIPAPSQPIQVSGCASQFNPAPISTPSRSKDLCLLSTQAPRFTCLLCLSWILSQSGSWYLHLTYIQVTSHLHRGPTNCILVPSKHHLKPIQVSRCVSRLHPCPSSTGSRSQYSVLTTSMYCLTSIQVHRFPSHLHPGRVSPPCRCWYLRLTDSRRLE